MITRRPITVTADSGQAKIYGTPDPTFTYAITAGTLFGADTLAGALARVAGENVGAYGINQGTLANANYAISFAGNNFGVTSALLTIRQTTRSSWWERRSRHSAPPIRASCLVTPQPASAAR